MLTVSSCIDDIQLKIFDQLYLCSDDVIDEIFDESHCVYTAVQAVHYLWPERL